MKPFLLSITFVLFSNMSFSQTVCKIFYTYDVNGDRTQRKYDCQNINPAQDKGYANPFNGIVYPNPTEGPFTVGFNELVLDATLSIHDMGGTLLSVYDQGESYEIDYDITDYIPGSYLLSLVVHRSDGTQATQEFVLIKAE